MAHVNDHPVIDLPTCPFGGEKNSGIGRFNGRWAIEAFTTDQWLTIQHAPRGFPWSAKAVQGAVVVNWSKRQVQQTRLVWKGRLGLLVRGQPKNERSLAVTAAWQLG